MLLLCGNADYSVQNIEWYGEGGLYDEDEVNIEQLDVETLVILSPCLPRYRYRCRCLCQSHLGTRSQSRSPKGH